MEEKLPKTVTFHGRKYKRVEAQQVYSVYVGTIYAEEETHYDNPAYGVGVDVGPTSAVAILAARDLDKLKRELQEAEASLLFGLEKAPTDWTFRLFTDIKAKSLHEFERQVREEWNNAEEILRDIHLGKAVMLENVIDKVLMGV